MTTFETNLSNLGKLLRLLYNPSLIPLLSFFGAGFLLYCYLIHHEKPNPSRKIGLVILLGLMVLIGLTISVWFFCQLDYRELFFNGFRIIFLGLIVSIVSYSEFFD